MKNVFRLLFAGVFLTGVVLGVVFLFNNSDLDNQVYNEFTATNYVASYDEADNSLTYLCDLASLNSTMENQKIKFVYAQKVLDALNLKLNNLIAETCNTTKATKYENDEVLNAMKKFKASNDKLSAKKNIYTTEYSQYSVNAKTDGYTVLYGYTTDVVKNAIELLKVLESYALKFVNNNIETVNYQDALLNIMSILCENVYNKILIKETYSTALINELSTITTYYNGLNNDYSVTPSGLNTSPAVRLQAYKHLTKNNILKDFLASEDKITYVSSLSGVDAPYAGYINNILGGPAV